MQKMDTRRGRKIIYLFIKQFFISKETIMIKTKAFSAFIICSILISGISNNSILGMPNEGEGEENALLLNDDQNEETASKKSWRRICTWKKAGIAFVAFLALSAVAVGGYELGKKSTQSHTPALPIENTIMRTCPAIFPLNMFPSCPSTDVPQYWSGAHRAEVVYSNNCVPECEGRLHGDKDDFIEPAVIVCERNSKAFKFLINTMKKRNVPYYISKNESNFYPSFTSLTYESEYFHVPPKHFTVEEIINDDNATFTIFEFFIDTQNSDPDSCPEYELRE